jgi:sterol desaturase/sphingolipid hydroxylase (fatty acid hydroxylase superfamily)
VIHYVTLVTSYVTKQFAALILPLDSEFSAGSLVSALLVAIAFVLLNRRRPRKAVRYRALFRALFPSWLYRSASFRADVMFLIMNVLAFGGLIAWATLSAHVISAGLSTFLATRFGPFSIGLTGFAGTIVVAISIFIAYELAYWFDHYLSHRIPVLWEFHKVHHTAEVLSPLTNFRVHPVDSIVFGNILGLFMGVTEGVLAFLEIGTPRGPVVNVLSVAFMWILGHLQHSHLWISTTGALGRVILSPAHHQIHHSDNPKHFNKNFGSFLSIWDWMFGTLHVPARRRERLTFGVGERAPQEHTLTGGLLSPFLRAWSLCHQAVLRTLPSRGSF